MRVTEKGQVTIPKNVRHQLGIRPGSQVEFTLDYDHAIIRLVREDAAAIDREVAGLMDHIRQRKGTMALGGLDRDSFMKMLRD